MPPHATFPPVRFFSLTHQSNHDAYENLSARLLAVQIDMLRCNRWLEFVDRRMQHVAAYYSGSNVGELGVRLDGRTYSIIVTNTSMCQCEPDRNGDRP